MRARRAPKTLCGGKYRVDGVLGEGGMGTVYAVTQLRVNRAYALKKLHPDLRLRRDIHQRFLREGWFANAVAVEHPGAVQVFEDGLDDDDLPFLVMELLDGATVDELGPKFFAKVPLREALCIAHQLLDVLHAAHQKSIVHRDIKPANLFLCRDGRLKVLDFGISKLRSMATQFGGSATHSLVGTPAFMSPEQAQAQGTDPRSDLFSVGATLFTIISGHPLHPGNHADEVIRRAANEPARSLADVAPETPPAVVELVARALAFDAAQRWQCAAAMRDAVLEVHQASFGPLDMAGLAALVSNKQPSTSEPSIGDLATEPWPSSEQTATISVGGRASQHARDAAEIPLSLLSSIDLPISGGSVGLSPLAAFTPSFRVLRSTLTASAVAAVLLATSVAVLQERWRSTDSDQAERPRAQVTTSVPARPAVLASPLATFPSHESPHDRERPVLVAGPQTLTRQAPAKPPLRQRRLPASGSAATAPAPAPVKSAVPASARPLIATPFSPPRLPLPDK